MASKSDLIWLETNVYQEALKRIDQIYNSHDEVWLSFSGGKDSLVCLHLILEYFDQEKITDKLNVLFRDEEIINGSIRRFVLSYIDHPRLNFRYYATQLDSEIYILGEKKTLIQWDENRKWIVDKPECAITLDGVHSQFTFDKHLFGKSQKRCCTIVGLRADESLMRFAGITMSKVCHMTRNPDVKNVTMGKPIYDWSEKDIFKYLHDKKIDYCEIYDHQVFNKDPLRVASAVHAEAAKRLYKIKTIDPVLYNQIMDVFPEVDVQARYYKDMTKGNANKIAYSYREKANGDPWSAIYMYIDQEIKDLKQNKMAKRKVARTQITRRNGKRGAFGGFPALYVFKKIIGGGYKRNIIPTPDLNDEYFEFENRSNRA
ncbi:MAG: putative uncharacterized nin region protein [Prokaryotic dsDNA virus sp.]|nr:MAG: putative uncharacterized nin region protein [Prokaryotic dsDNA virus sp.]|tara:strand:- start:88 stop:1206 length:1119 start_codon:yes stop_codon:yes gene_type:complete